MKKSVYWIIGLSILVGAFRFSVPGVHRVVSWEDSYEALAHIWVGILFAQIIIHWRGWRLLIQDTAFWCLFIINAIEITAFFYWR